MTKTNYPIEAFTLDRKRKWELNASFTESLHVSRFGAPVIQLYGPIAYYVDDLLEHWDDDIEDEKPFPLLCIDAMGRNFGTRFGTSVYVYKHKVREIMREALDR